MQQPDFAQSGAELTATVQHVFERMLQLGVVRTEEPAPVGESRDQCTCCFSEELAGPSDR